MTAYSFASPPMASDQWQDEDAVLELRRTVQKHFLAASTYIPMDDIIVHGKIVGEDEMVAKYMQKACGIGQLYVWLPFRFRLPLIGERIIEWCWMPPIKVQA